MTTSNILLIFFMLFNTAGFFLILLKTGDYDADMFTKILGWILFLPGFIGLLYYHKWIGLLLFVISLLIVIFLKKRKDNESTY
jgi:nucleoside permease NupC